MSHSPSSNNEMHSRFELRTLLETSRLLIESRDMDFVLNNLLLITMGKLLVTKAMVIIHQPASDTYRVTKSKGRGCPKEGTTISPEWDKEILEESVIQCGIDDIEIPELIDGEQNCTLFNLQTSDSHIGFLCLGPKGNKKPLSKHEVEFVESLSIISSVAIANSRLFSELRRINRMLDRKVYELNTLFDLSKDFNMMVDRDEIIRVFKFAMLGQMLIRKFFFVLEYEDKRKMVTTSGIEGSAKKKEINKMFNLDKDLVEVDPVLEEEIPFLAKNEIKALIGLKLQDEKTALVGVGARANNEPYSTSDYNFLRSLGNLALLSIQKTHLLEERIEKERMEEELNIAKHIQQGLLPDPLPTCEKLDVAARNISSYQIGGDYYDVLETPEKNLLVAIGDVTGKGIPASLLMANLQAMLHVLLPVDITLSNASGQVNNIIYRNTPSDKFITFFWGIFHPDTNMFRYVNAGHNPPLLFREGEETPRELEEGGLILGAMPTSQPYDETKIELVQNDILVLFTDGVTEALNPEETEEYEEKRLIACIEKNRKKSAEGILDAIITDVHNFSGERQYDDITLVVVKVI